MLWGCAALLGKQSGARAACHLTLSGPSVTYRSVVRLPLLVPAAVPWLGLKRVFWLPLEGFLASVLWRW